MEMAKILRASRDRLGLTRDQARQLLCIGESTLEKYENGSLRINEKTVELVSRKYSDPMICAHYCKLGCTIGSKLALAPRTDIAGDMGQVTLHILGELKNLNNEVDQITRIGKLNEVDELAIEDTLMLMLKMQHAIEAYKSTVTKWVDIQQVTKQYNKDFAKHQKVRV